LIKRKEEIDTMRNDKRSGKHYATSKISRPKKRRAKILNLKKSKLILLIIFIVFFIYVSISFSAKYVVNLQNTTFAKSTDLLFVSDYLTNDEEIPEYDIYSDSVIFKLKNNDDENLYKNEQNVSYIITTSAGTLSSSSGTLKNGSNDEDAITLTSDSEQSCIVEVTTKKPYTTTLKAKFNFIGVGEKTGYKITYKGYYVVLDLYTGNNLEDIVIDYSGFEPDTANSLMSSFTNGTTGTIESGDLEKNSHYELFFKKGTSTGTHNKTEIQRYTSKIKIGG